MEEKLSLLLSFGKKRKADHTMRVLTKDNIDTVTDPYHFYRNLCSAESFDELACSLFLGVDFPKLTEEAHATCNDRLTEEELREALFHGEQQIPWGGQTLDKLL